MSFIRKFWEALLAERKLKWKILAIALPLIVVARYTLFRGKAEFAAFFDTMKLIILPVVVLALAVTAWSILRMQGKTKAEQERLANAAFWLNTAIVVAAVLAGFAYTKVESA